eukprot:14941594-Alexandrium_andersonii.AAC.1
MCIRDRLETARNYWNPLEPAGTAAVPPLKTLRCRTTIDEAVVPAGPQGETSLSKARCWRQNSETP